MDSIKYMWINVSYAVCRRVEVSKHRLVIEWVEAHCYLKNALHHEVIVKTLMSTRQLSSKVSVWCSWGLLKQGCIFYMHLLGILGYFSIRSTELKVVVLRLLVLFSCAFVKCAGLAFFSLSGVIVLFLVFFSNNMNLVEHHLNSWPLYSWTMWESLS